MEIPETPVTATESRPFDFILSGSEDDQVAYMAIINQLAAKNKAIAKATVQRISIDDSMPQAYASSDSADWEQVDQELIFKIGAFKGKKFPEILQKYPQQVKWCDEQVKKNRPLTAELQRFYAWAKLEQEEDEQLGGGPCQHSDFHNKGSSAKYRRFTCKKCGFIWQEERNAPTISPDECQHKRTDRRGSTKNVVKTFCLDCGTTVESIPREVAEELQQEREDALRPSVEEAMISERKS
jgi:hypothetical protein